MCSNCGAEEFVWVDNLRTGTIGRGSLSLRSGGELPLGTRICRGCGHADLFLKDPTILRQPHAWRQGEFLPIPSRPAAGPTPAPSPTSEAPVSAPPPPPPDDGTSEVTAPPPPPPPPGLDMPAPTASLSTGAAEDELAPKGSEARRPARRRSSSRAKGSVPPPTHD